MSLDRRQFIRTTVLASAGLAVGGVAVGTSQAMASNTPDLYNPFTAYPVTGTWQDHMSYSEGGIDFGMPVGTDLPSAMEGTVSLDWDYGSGGYAIFVTHSSGWVSAYLHCSEFTVADGAKVAKGQVIARSGGEPGAPGAGESDGPHLHWHLVHPDGTRRSPLDHANGAAPSGNDRPTSSKLPRTSTESDGQPGKIFHQRMQVWAKKEGGYKGPIDGSPGPNTWKGVQTALRKHGYTGPIDGQIGTNGNKALQRLAAKHGYTGPIDGQPGKNTYKALAKFLNQPKFDQA